MKVLLIALASLAFFSAPIVAQDESKPASEALVRQFLEVSNARVLIDRVFAQIQQMTQTSLDQALAGQPVSPTERAIIQRSMEKTNAVMAAELTWEKLEPLYLEIYCQALTEQEVQGMIDFYQTPAGKAVMTKLPQLTQQMMVRMQANMGPLMEKMQKISQETMQELAAERTKAGKS